MHVRVDHVQDREGLSFDVMIEGYIISFLHGRGVPEVIFERFSLLKPSVGICEIRRWVWSAT